MQDVGNHFSFYSNKPGINFTIILQAAFTHADPKSAKKDSQVKQLFALLGSASVKAACKHVDEIDPRRRCSNDPISSPSEIEMKEKNEEKIFQLSWKSRSNDPDLLAPEKLGTTRTSQIGEKESLEEKKTEEQKLGQSAGGNFTNILREDF